MNSANYKAMTDNQLIERVEYLVRRERELVECLIWHLQEVQDRKLFIQLGYTSLFECLVKHFKYSEAVAYSRISALKILNTVPEAATALSAGEVNVTTLSLTQSFIRKQEKESGEKVSDEKKIQYLNSIKNKSVEEAKQILATISPCKKLPLDKVQFLDSDHARLEAIIERSILEKIEKLKSLISHENLTPSYNDLLNIALDAAVEKIEKKKGINEHPQKSEKEILEKPNSDFEYLSPQKRSQLHLKESKENTGRKEPDFSQLSIAKQSPKTSTQSFSVKSSRYISRQVKRNVLRRSQGQCEHVHHTGQRCTSQFQLQFDHVLAHSKGGGNEFDNIQNLCRVHNAYKSAH